MASLDEVKEILPEKVAVGLKQFLEEYKIN